MKTQQLILTIILSSFVFSLAFNQAGIIFPSITIEERDNLKVEAGHTIFNRSTQTINYFDGKTWINIHNGISHKSNSYQDRIQDMDGDTKIQIANAVPLNTMDFYLSGIKRLHIRGHRIEPLNNGNSVFIGFGAGQNDDLSNNGNTFLGYQSGFQNTTGHTNAFVGRSSGFSNTSGFRNIFLGYRSGMFNTSGNQNIYMGYQTGHNNVSGSDNTFIGSRAGYNNTGSRNVYLGYMAGFNATGSNQLYIDNSSTSSPLIYGNFLTNRVGINGDLGIGTQAPSDELSIIDNDNDGDAVIRMQTNSGHILLGFNPSNQGIIGTQSKHDLRFRTHAANRMTIDYKGDVGIGTTVPSQKLHVVGNICATGNIGTCSDIRYKKDFQKIDSALSHICALNGYFYNWNTEAFPENDFSNKRQIGVIAQEVEVLFPEMVLTDSLGYKSVDYARLTPVLIEAIKELKVEITQQEKDFNDELTALKEHQATMSQILMQLVQASEQTSN